MDIAVYLKNNPIDYAKVANLLTSSAQLEAKDLNKLEVLCIDYRLQQLNSTTLSDLLLPMESEFR